MNELTNNTKYFDIILCDPLWQKEAIGLFLGNLGIRISCLYVKRGFQDC